MGFSAAAAVAVAAGASAASKASAEKKAAKQGTTTTASPWAEQAPYLSDAFQSAEGIYNTQKGTPWYQGNLYTGLNDTQHQGIILEDLTGAQDVLTVLGSDALGHLGTLVAKLGTLTKLGVPLEAGGGVELALVLTQAQDALTDTKTLTDVSLLGPKARGLGAQVRPTGRLRKLEPLVVGVPPHGGADGPDGPGSLTPHGSLSRTSAGAVQVPTGRGPVVQANQAGPKLVGDISGGGVNLGLNRGVVRVSRGSVNVGLGGITLSGPHVAPQVALKAPGLTQGALGKARHAAHQGRVGT